MLCMRRYLTTLRRPPAGLEVVVLTSPYFALNPSEVFNLSNQCGGGYCILKERAWREHAALAPPLAPSQQQQQQQQQQQSATIHTSHTRAHTPHCRRTHWASPRGTNWSEADSSRHQRDA